MKHFLTTLTCILFAACLEAGAQYLPNKMDVSRGQLTDENGIVLSDRQVLEAVGQQIYDETYRGAVKQYNTGSRLVLAGAITTGVGSTVALVSLLAWGDAITDYYSSSRYGYEYRNEGQAAAAALCYCVGALTASAGFTALSAGIVFKSIGRGRLNWVADNYNEHNRPVTMKFGAGQYGTGLVVNF